jgi:DNA-binding response OmpR family regulator
MRNERRLLRLVEQMLAIARMESGKLELRMVRCDLAALAGEIVSIFQPAAERKQVELQLQGECPVWVCCDPDWTGQAITNLVVNALQYSPAGGTVRVDVSSDPVTGQILLRVSDEGPGIGVEEAERVFDRFYQTQSGLAASYAGMGVGLSLVKEIVELHHGEVSVTSTPGEGATFEIVLPGGGDLSASGEWEPDSSRAARHELEALVGDLISEETDLVDEEEGSGRRLLVIAEDDRDLRDYLRTHLGTEYRLRFASSGEAAWNLVQAEVPDVVVSDVMMPGTDGYELCRRIRSSPETDYVPVVLLTAKAETGDRIEGLDCGADDYVSKPFEIVELRARIRNLLASRERLRARFAGEMAPAAVASPAEVPESADAVFLQKVTDTIRRNAHRQDFGVEQLAKELAISRMHLYRRLSELVGQSPADLLMEHRLQRAAELLKAKAGNVSEVAYGTGFKSVSHFTKRFREKFGHTPSEHRFLRQQSGALD